MTSEYSLIVPDLLHLQLCEMSRCVRKCGNTCDFQKDLLMRVDCMAMITSAFKCLSIMHNWEVVGVPLNYDLPTASLLSTCQHGNNLSLTRKLHNLCVNESFVHK